MKTAQEMFEELGFGKRSDTYYIKYFEDRFGRNSGYVSIVFNNENKIYSITNVDERDELWSSNINIKLHKAISKQIEELRW